jgi:hypothetical protein
VPSRVRWSRRLLSLIAIGMITVIAIGMITVIWLAVIHVLAAA